jgi:hypothetical protein
VSDETTEAGKDERAHGTDHGHIVQVRSGGMLSTRLAQPGEWFCGHCGIGVPEAIDSDAGGVRESSSRDADGAQVRPLASVPPAEPDAGDVDRDEWCICSTEYRATYGDTHTRTCSQEWGDLTRLLDAVRRKAADDALTEAAADWWVRTDIPSVFDGWKWLRDRADRIARGVV